MTERESSLGTREKGPTTNVAEESSGSEPSFVRPRPSLTVDTDNENYRPSKMNKLDMAKIQPMSSVQLVAPKSTTNVDEVSFVRPIDTSLVYDTDAETERLKEKNAKRIKLLSQEKRMNNKPIAKPPPKEKKMDEKTASSVSSTKKPQGKDSSYDTEAEMIKTLKNFDPAKHGNKFAPPSPSKVLKLPEKTRKKKTKGQEIENMEASPPHVVSFPTTPPLITVSQPRRRNEKRASTMKAVAKNKNNSNSESDEDELEGTPKRFWRRNSGTDDVDFDPNKKNVTSQSQAQGNLSQNYTKIQKTVGNLGKHVDAMVSSPEIDEPVIRPQQKSIMRRSPMAARNRSSQISMMSSSRSIQLPGSQTNNVYAKVLSQNFSNPNQLSQEPGASVNPELPSVSENDQKNNVETEITSLEKEDMGIQKTKERKLLKNETVTSPTAKKSNVELAKNRGIRIEVDEVVPPSDGEGEREEEPTDSLVSPLSNLAIFEQIKEIQMKKNVQAHTNSKENEVQKNRNTASITTKNNMGDENNHSLVSSVNADDSESENESSSSDAFDDSIIQLPPTRKNRPQQAKVKLPSKKKAPLNQQTKDSDEEVRQPAATGSNDSNSKQKKRPSPSEDPTSLPLVDHEEESENMQILPPLIPPPAVAGTSRALRESEARMKSAKVALQKPRKSVKNASLPSENDEEERVPKLHGLRWGPNHPIMENEGKVLYNNNLLTKEDVEKLINKHAKSAKLTPEQKNNFLQNINLYLKNTFNDLCDETEMYCGVWSLQQLTKRLKQDGVLDTDAKDNDYVALFENTVGSKVTKKCVGFHIPKRGKSNK